jgi:hypothetical protein
VKEIPVLRLVERGGEARSIVFQKVTGMNIRNVRHEHVSLSAVLVTDASGAYTEAGRMFESHGIVDHTKDEYVRGAVYSNTALLFTVEASLDGTYHHFSE